MPASWTAESLALDRTSPEPLYAQIASGIRRLIDAGHLAPGIKLPSSRELATRLEVHRTTITAAYRRLAEAGFVLSGVGQGTFVADGPKTAAVPGPPGPLDESGTRLRWNGLVRSAATRPFQAVVTRHTIVMDRAIPDPDLYPLDHLRNALADLLREPSSELFSYGPPAGDDGLRELIRRRVEATGVDMSNAEVLVVGGSQQGIDLVARLLLRDGGAVVVDSPTYRGALEVFRLNGAEILSLPMRDGITDVEALDALLVKRRVRLIYAMPTFHNPTGATLDAAARQSLYDIAARHRVPILEDDWLSDLRRPGDPVPVKALDRAGLVIQSGTFSKTAVPGFRVGWLTVPRELFEAFVDLKSHCDLSTGLLGQQALARLIEEHHYDSHVARVRERYQERLERGLAALAALLPETITWTRPRGGIVNWLWLPPGLDGNEIAQSAARRDVLVSPGELYQSAPQRRGGLRLCYSLCTPERIEEGVERLADAIRESLERNRPGARRAPAPLV